MYLLISKIQALICLFFKVYDLTKILSTVRRILIRNFYAIIDKKLFNFASKLFRAMGLGVLALADKKLGRRKFVFQTVRLNVSLTYFVSRWLVECA